MRYGILLLTLVLCACAKATYIPKGLDPTDPSTFSVLTGDPDTYQELSDSETGVITINEIDGKSLSGLRYRNGYPQTVFVKPGLHQIYVPYRQAYGTAGECLEIDTVAGEWYIVRMRAIGYTVAPWIENAQTGEVTGYPCGMNTTPPECPSESKGLGT